jgi:Cu(I)/Ag(I) efflux system membrane protein CusA/SilA
MIKTENGRLVGYVFADVDGSIRDLGGWVRDARRLVDALLELPAGMRLAWTGQYEFLADMQSRLAWMVPLTLALIVGLLYLAMGGWGQALLVLLSVPFAVAGSIWLLAVLDYNLSTAVWVGIIAVGGVAAQTAIVVVVYLDQALKAAHDAVALQAEEAIDAAGRDHRARAHAPALGERGGCRSVRPDCCPRGRRHGVLPGADAARGPGRLCHVASLAMAPRNPRPIVQFLNRRWSCRRRVSPRCASTC